MKIQLEILVVWLLCSAIAHSNEQIHSGLPEGSARIREGRQRHIYAVVSGHGGAVIRVSDGRAELWQQGRVESVEATQDGDIWLVQDGRITRHRSGGPDQVVPVDRTPSFHPDGKPGALFATRHGDLYAAGCQCYRRRNGMFTALPVTPEPGWHVQPFADDSYGNVWAIAAAADGSQRQLAVLAEERPHQWERTVVSEDPADSWLETCSDDVGAVWVATARAVIRVDPQAVEVAALRISSPERSPITSIERVRNRQIIAGFEDGSIRELTVESGSMPRWKLVTSVGEGPIRAMHHDHLGQLWVITGDSLYRSDSLMEPWHHDWDEQSRLPVGNHDLAFARIGRRLYTAGGKTYFGSPASQWTNLDHIWAYDIDRGVWHIEAPMLEPGKAYSGVAALNGELWLIGGYFIEGGGTKPTATVEVYNPRTGRFRLGPPLAEPRGQVVALTLGGRLYAIGGGVRKMLSIGAGETEWRQEPAPPGPVAQASGCVLSGRIYVAAGAHSECPGLFVYDPRPMTWSKIKHPTESAPQAPLCAAYQDRIWVMGGTGESGGRMATHVYSPKDNQWQAGPDLPLPVSWGAAADVDGRLFIAGGAYRELRVRDYYNSDRAFFLRQR